MMFGELYSSVDPNSNIPKVVGIDGHRVESHVCWDINHTIICGEVCGDQGFVKSVGVLLLGVKKVIVLNGTEVNDAVGESQRQK